MHQAIDIEALCAQRGLRITDQRRVIAKVLSESTDHPDVEALHERASAIDPRISIATGVGSAAPASPAPLPVSRNVPAAASRISSARCHA